MDQLDASQLLRAMESQDLEEAVSLLLHHVVGLDASEALRRVRDRTGCPLVVRAIQLNQPQVLDVLLELGCETQEQDLDSDEEEEEDEDDDVYHGCSPLCLAVHLGHGDCARVLIAHGASVDAPSRGDSTLHTPLHVAATYNCVGAWGLAEMARVSTDLDARDMSDSTPLHLATTYNDHSAALSLLGAGANVRATDPFRSMPLHIAASQASYSLAELFLSLGVDVDARTVHRNTPLLETTFVGHYAMRSTSSDSDGARTRMVTLLLAHGADIDAQNRDGNTALIGAVWNGFTDAALALLASGADVSITNRRGETALHTAAHAGTMSLEVWHGLLRAGGDAVAQKDRQARTCYDIWVSRIPRTDATDVVASLLEVVDDQASAPAQHT